MAKTIGNPLSWSAQMIGDAVSHAANAVRRVGPSATETVPEIREIGLGDLREALRLGIADFSAFRSDVIFICLLYPVMGVLLGILAIQGNLWQLLFPILSGFALVGPFAAVGLYEMSRRREEGTEANWSAVLDIISSPRFGAILVLGLFHVAIFAVWITVADLIFNLTLGPEAPASAMGFVNDVFTTGAGWAMIILGGGVGFLFAAAVLATSVVSFPILIERRVGVAMAIVTSVRVAQRNPFPIALWGLIVAVLLAVGILPFLLGLVIVLPILGHATWHLYRKAVTPP